MIFNKKCCPDVAPNKHTENRTKKAPYNPLIIKDFIGCGGRI